jgi:hypothetical protein
MRSHTSKIIWSYSMPKACSHAQTDHSNAVTSSQSRGGAGMPRLQSSASPLLHRNSRTAPIPLQSNASPLKITMASTKAYPPGGTFLDTVKRSFTDVPVDKEKDNAVSTSEFLEAAESLTTMFGMRDCLSMEIDTDQTRCIGFNGLPTR